MNCRNLLAAFLHRLRAVRPTVLRFLLRTDGITACITALYLGSFSSLHCLAVPFTAFFRQCGDDVDNLNTQHDAETESMMAFTTRSSYPMAYGVTVRVRRVTATR